MTPPDVRAAPEPLQRQSAASPERRGGRALALLCLAVVLLVGAYVRVAHLGRADFGVDELYQVFAAEGLRQNGDLVMPSGSRYTRGADVTHMIRLLFDAAGESPAAARLPSAFFGVAGLLLFMAVLWALAGPWVAVVGGILLAIYPEAVKQSREVRFYTYHAVWGVAALYSGWKALAPIGPTAPIRRAQLERWMWAGLTLLLLAMAVRIQPVSYSVLAGWGGAALLLAILDLRREGRQVLYTSVPAQLVLLGSAAALFAVVAFPDWLASRWWLARSVPGWILTAEGGLHPFFYYHVLAATFPALLAALPLLLAGALLQHARLAMFAAAWYGVPLFLHSFIFPMKGERFVMVPALGLFLLAGLGTVYWGTLLLRFAHRAPGISVLAGHHRKMVGGALLAASAAFALLVTPALHQARGLPGGEQSRRWSVAAELLAAQPELAHMPLGSTLALHALHYLHRLDFMLGDPTLQDATLRPDGLAISWENDGGRERDTGVPIVAAPAELRLMFPDAPGVVVAVEDRLIRIGRVDPAFVRALAADGLELCQGRCPGLLLYAFPFSRREEP
jgi:hypothetical protein